MRLFAENRGAYAVTLRAPHNCKACLKQQRRRRGHRQTSASSETASYKRIYSDTYIELNGNHSSLTSISVLQRFGGVTVMRYIILHFIYLLTYILASNFLEKLFLSRVEYRRKEERVLAVECGTRRHRRLRLMVSSQVRC